MDKDIGKINKGEYQGAVTDIVIGVREYNGSVGVDIREYTTSDKYTGPTKKGLRIPAKNFQEFKQMINSISPNDLVASGEGASSGESSVKKTTQKKFAPDDDIPDY
jgi:Transcriptional Coactivator p15 (PC4)